MVAHIGAAGWPILGIAAHTPEIEQETLESVRRSIAGYGLNVLQMGNFTISMKDEDEANLKRFRTALQMKRLNGDQPPAAPAVAPATAVHCAACGGENIASARFCSTCGKPLTVSCPSCSTPNQPGSKFCSNCGSALG